MKKAARLGALLMIAVFFLTALPAAAAAGPKVLWKPDLASIPEGEPLPDELAREHNGLVSDGKGGLVSATADVYNAVYFGVPSRQYHFHAVMEPVNPGEPVVGGLSMKVNLDLDPGGAKRMDLAVTTGGGGKSILLYAFGTLICDNRNTHQGGLGEETNDAFNTTDPVVIDLYGDRNYVAVYINGMLVIENILPLEGKGVFGLRSSSSAVRYTDLYIEELGDTLLDGRERYYPQTFETIAFSGPETLATGEKGSFSVRLSPEGRAYESVQWTVNGEVVMGETGLTLSHGFYEPGEYEVSCVVDRQKAVGTVTVTGAAIPRPETEEPPAGTEVPGPGPLPWILGGTGAAALAVLAAAVLLLRRKRKV